MNNSIDHVDVQHLFAAVEAMRSRMRFPSA